MAETYNEKDLIQGINEQMNFVKNLSVEDVKNCAGSMRSALEYAVKLFWLKKHDKKPVWIKNGKEAFDFCEAISDARFSGFFDKIMISYMHMLRTRCNDVIHGGSPLTLNETTELLSILDKCIRAIESVLKQKIIFDDVPKVNKEPVSLERTNESEEIQQVECGESAIPQPGDFGAPSYLRHFKPGDTVNAETNAAFLNQLFGTDYKAWMKSGYDFDIDKGIWMVSLDGVVRSGWKDYWEDGNIIEEYVGENPRPTNFNAGAKPHWHKYVFEKIGYGNARRYVFRGVFRFERYLTPTKRASVLESTEGDVYKK